MKLYLASALPREFSIQLLLMQTPFKCTELQDSHHGWQPYCLWVACHKPENIKTWSVLQACHGLLRACLLDSYVILEASCHSHSQGQVLICLWLTKFQGFSWSKVLAVPGCVGAELHHYRFCSDTELLTCCSESYQGWEVLDHDFANCSLLLPLSSYPDKIWI